MIVAAIFLSPEAAGLLLTLPGIDAPVGLSTPRSIVNSFCAPNPSIKRGFDFLFGDGTVIVFGFSFGGDERELSEELLAEVTRAAASAFGLGAPGEKHCTTGRRDNGVFGAEGGLEELLDCTLAEPPRSDCGLSIIGGGKYDFRLSTPEELDSIPLDERLPEETMIVKRLNLNSN